MTCIKSCHLQIFVPRLDLGKCGVRVCTVAQLHRLTGDGLSNDLSELEYYTNNNEHKNCEQYVV